MGLHTWVWSNLILPHRLENEAEFDESIFLQARPGLMAARSPLPSASLKKSQGTPRKGRAPTGMNVTGYQTIHMS